MSMANTGASPLNPATPVGQLRANIGDVTSAPLDPEVPGQAAYQYFSDAELLAYLLTAAGSITRATGLAIMQLALGAGLTGRSVKTDDLALDSRTRGTTLLAIAQSWLSQADAEEQGAVADIFEVVPAGRGRRYPDAFPAQRYAPPPPPAGTFSPDPTNPGYFVP